MYNIHTVMQHIDVMLFFLPLHDVTRMIKRRRLKPFSLDLPFLIYMTKFFLECDWRYFMIDPMKFMRSEILLKLR